MISKKQAFADDIVRFFAMFPGIQAYAEEAGKVGGLEQAADEAEARLEKAKRESHKFEEIKAKFLAEAQAAADKLYAEAQAQANDVTKQATAFLAETKADTDRARVTALNDLQADKAELEIQVKNAVGQRSARQAELNETNKRLDAARVEYDKLLNDIRAARTTLDEVRRERAALATRLAS